MYLCVSVSYNVRIDTIYLRVMLLCHGTPPFKDYVFNCVCHGTTLFLLHVTSVSTWEFKYYTIAHCNLM